MNILIEFSANTKGVETAEEAVNKLAGTDKGLQKQFASTNNEIKEREKSIDKVGSAVDEYAGKLKAAEKASSGAFGVKALKEFETASAKTFQKLIAGATAAGKGLKGIEKEISAGITDALNEAGVTAEEFEAALKEAGVTAEDFAAQIVKTAQETDGFDEAVDNAGKKSESLKTQLRKLKDELAAMESAGQEGTQAFEDMAIQAAALEDQIGDTNERIKVLASDTANLDAAVEGVRLLGTGFQLATAGAALFGQEDEELQKTLVKLNAVMAITQSLQEVQTFVRGQSILALKAETFFTNAQSIAQKAYAIAVGTSTGAMKAFRIALFATGIGAIIGLLILVAEKMNLFGDAVDDTTEKLKAEAEAAEKLEESLTKVADASEKARNAQNSGLDTLSRELNLIKARGETAQKVYDKEQEIRRAELFNLQVRLSTFEGNKNKELEISKEIADKQNEIEAAKLAFEKEQNDQAVDAYKDALKKKQDAAEKAKEKADELARRNAEALSEIQRLSLENQAEASKQIAENETLNFEVRNNAAIRYIALQKQLVENESAQAKAIAQTTGEIQLAELKKTQAIEKINSESAKLVYDIWKQNQKNLADMWRAPDVPDATQEQLDKQFALIKAGLDKQEKEIDESNKRKAEKEKAAAELRRAVATQLLGAVQQGADAIFERQAEQRQQAFDHQIELLNRARDLELESKNLTEANKADINKKYAEKERQLKLRAFEDDKKAKRNQAIINGLLAVTNALATAPTIIAGIILAAAVAVSTAIQVAKINATQPGFKKGGYTGDKPVDQVAGVTHGKEYVSHAEATKRYRPALEAMHNLKFEEWLANNAPPKTMTPVPEYYSPTQTPAIDYDELGRSVARHAAPGVKVEMKADENGLSIFLTEKNRQVEIRNKYYNA